MICPKCNTINDDNEKFCKNCGFQLNSTRICPKCNTVNKNNSKYCRECGTTLTPVNTFRQDVINEEKEKSFFSLYKIPIICGLILILALGVVAGVGILNSNGGDGGLNSFIPLANDNSDDLNQNAQGITHDNASTNKTKNATLALNNTTDDKLNLTNDTGAKNITVKVNNDTNKSNAVKSSTNSDKDKSQKSTVEKSEKDKSADNSIVKNKSSSKSSDSNSITIKTNDSKSKSDSILPIIDDNNDSDEIIDINDDENDSSDADDLDKDNGTDDAIADDGDDLTDVNDSDDSIADDSDDLTDGDASDNDTDDSEDILESSSSIAMTDVPNLALEVSNRNYQFSSISYKGNDYTQAQCIDIFAEYILNIQKGSNDEIDIDGVSSASSPSGADESQTIEKSDYLSIANRVHSWIDSQSSVPNYVGVSTVGADDLSPSKMLQLFTQVILDYSVSGSLPSSVDI